MFSTAMSHALTVSTSLLRPGGSVRPDLHPAMVYLARLSPGSRRTMRQALDYVAALLSGGRCDAEALPWHAVRYTHAQAVRSAAVASYSPATASKVLSALRGVVREAWRLGLMPAEDHARIADVQGVKGTVALRGRALKPGEVVALFGSCDSTTAQGARDAALLALLYGAGLRRSEVVGLDLSDYDSESGALTVRKGKGGKDRTVYATNGAKQALDAWLDVRGNAPGALLLAVGKNGEPRPGHMSGQAVYSILERVRTEARVKDFSPHDCRRSYVTALLSSGASIAVVQKLAGHASVNTTARYDRSDEDAKRKVSELLHVPFAG
jgi:integrase/recombinase XerD